MKGEKIKLNFSYLIDTIPKDMYSKTKSYISRHIAIFEPEEYAVGEIICVDDYHFILFFSQAPVTRIGYKEYKVKKGDMLVVQPWEKVYGVPCGHKKFDKYMHIAVKKDFFQKVATEIAGGEAFEFKRVQNTYSRQLLDLIGSFQREFMDHGESYPLMIESISIQIVFQLIRDLHADYVDNVRKVSKDNKYINKAIQFMQEYYSSNISIKDICNLIYLSPCHFKRVFKDYTGRTPHQYLTQIRIEKAKELLREKENSMEEIAKLCGFINPGHFSTVFKRNLHMSPTEYRKMER